MGSVWLAYHAWCVFEVKDGRVLGCGVRCRCVCMQFRCSGQRLSRGQSAWAEERNTGDLRAWGDLGRNEKRMRDCPYVWLLCENVRQRHEYQRKEEKGERSMRAVCYAACSCNLRRGREKAGDCEMANRLEKGEKGFAWYSGSGVVGPGRC